MGTSEPAMGGDIGGDLGPAPDLAAGGELPAPAPELGGGELPAPELGGETPPAPEKSRAKRESVDYSRKLGMLLNSKKK